MKEEGIIGARRRAQGARGRRLKKRAQGPGHMGQLVRGKA